MRHCGASEINGIFDLSTSIFGVLLREQTVVSFLQSSIIRADFGTCPCIDGM